MVRSTGAGWQRQRHVRAGCFLSPDSRARMVTARSISIPPLQCSDPSPQLFPKRTCRMVATPREREREKGRKKRAQCGGERAPCQRRRPAGSGMWERGAQKVAPTPTPTRVSRTLGRFGRTSPSVRPHGGPLSRLVRPVAWQLARRSPHTTPCCCNARRSALRPSLCALSRPPLLNHISIATQRKASSIMQHPLRLSVYSAVHSVKLATVCRRGMSVVKPNLFLFLGPRLFDTTRHTQCSTATLVPDFPTLRTVYYATAAATAHSSVPQLLKPTPCCHVFNAAVKKSHTVRVRVAKKR